METLILALEVLTLVVLMVLALRGAIMVARAVFLLGTWLHLRERTRRLNRWLRR